MLTARTNGNSRKITEQGIAHGLFSEVEIRSGKRREDIVVNDELAPAGSLAFREDAQGNTTVVCSTLREISSASKLGCPAAHVTMSSFPHHRLNHRRASVFRLFPIRLVRVASSYLQFQLLTLAPIPLESTYHDVPERWERLGMSFPLIRVFHYQNPLRV